MNTIYDGSFVLGQTSATNFVAGPGIKIDEPSAGTVRIGNDETVLWSGDIIQNQTAALNDNWQNYEGIKVYGFATPGGAMYGEAKTIDLISAYDTTYNPAVWNPDIALTTIASWNHRENFNINCTLPLTFTATTSVSAMNGRMMGYWDGKFQFTGSQPKIHLSKIVGINRISGGNE